MAIGSISIQLPASKEGTVGPEMSGADCVVASLEKEGVTTIFAYPGGASMPMHQSLTRAKSLRTVLPRHEQGGVFMAEGYARATGKVGVCMSTSGPGATNLVTGIADAYMDSVPLVAITGQVKKDMIGKGAFQETDVFGITLPIVKHSYLVIDPREIPQIIKEALLIARSGRPGPVVIDIPKDVQQAVFKPFFPTSTGLEPKLAPPPLDRSLLKTILDWIEKAKRPVLYVGGGIISSGAHLELLKFAERTNIPVTTTLMGIGSFPENHKLSLKWLGMHGSVYANFAVDQCDLLLAFGVRFDDRVTGKVEAFAPKALIVHIDIDNSELNKNKRVDLAVLGDIKEALSALNQLIDETTWHPPDFSTWHEEIQAWKMKFPFRYRKTEAHILPQMVVEEIYKLTRGEAIITTGVGQHQMWAGQFYNFHHPRTFLTSGGLGAMGFGYPAALGAKIAIPDATVIDIDGDGSFLMNIQELATAVTEEIPVKAIILNNQHLGMVVQWEDRFYDSNRAHTFLGCPNNKKRIYPDFPQICKGFGVRAERVTKPEELVPALKRMLEAQEPYVLDVIVPYTEHVLPMIPAGMTVKDIIIEND
ncbi:acetolactate synthase, large subunit, biosynthetic type [Candidatus Methylacidiphilum fumarolicum]|uniref:Acetolactate synthase n=2 Tax=Candidatus Methylacidiphilum fumarolicum TaxID=591154 RepID=I0JVD9_METFB|nr:biosynthetic-type acetolactate synthase large subunit [Candidatus Methylacidiphilum fumarolicum]MBW6414888.1 biosynthetic-type acetolactate synthase large subunit [Candidatus Methylacidiphilum fumarolicum]TFE68327.1 acetolactate synthase, large subunit, biosynthetic type [Candidatus Methylacidiphilum fumarolicum]TFE73552.1 acetolactate synthase, large subunit, biosynthetic type [Candidatus Methylacidiphilum fumarolicum]TFE74987.1 acetolactate synthase, large subunit, biosynthetic type [Candi